MARKSYDERTHRSTRDGIIAAGIVNDQGPERVVNRFDEEVFAWRSRDMQRFTNADLRSWLTGIRVTDPDEAIAEVPPSAFRYAVTKGWLRKDRAAPFYWITKKGGMELNLPVPVVGNKRCPFPA